MNVWQELGIDRTRNVRDIKRAYAVKLKKIHPDEDPKAFQNLRRAYEFALKLAGKGEREESTKKPLSQLFKLSHGEGTSLFTQTRSDAESEEFVQAHPLFVCQPWVEKIKNALQHSETLAIHYFRRAMEQPDMLHLETRELFGDLLLKVFSSTKPFPKSFFGELDKVFQWTNSADQFHQTSNAHVDYVIRRLQAHRYFQRLQSSFYQGEGERTKIKVYDVIVGPYRPRYYQWLIRSRKVTDAVLNLIEEIQHYYPELIKHEMDARVVDWWQQAARQIHVQWHHIIAASLITLVSGYFIVTTSQTHYLLVFMFPLIWTFVLAADYGGQLWHNTWRHQFRDLIGSRWGKNSEQHSQWLSRAVWFALLVLSMVAGHWIPPAGLLVSITLFYGLMSMVVDWRILSSVTALSFVSILLLQAAIYFSQTPLGSSVGMAEGMGLINLVNHVGLYAVFLALVLIYSVVVVYFVKRAS